VSSDNPPDLGAAEAASTVLPVGEERLHVAKRDVLSGRVRISTATDTIEEVVRQELQSVRAEVERVPIDRYLEPGEALPQPRTEGDLTIIPVLEEVLVVEKRLLLREELHIRREASVEDVEIPVTLRRQRAVVERLRPDAEDTEDPQEN
jgi:uncharacterized protein (TIGR02271 family)